MGLKSEIMCKHRIYGKKIYKNVQFIEACNSYRIWSKKSEQLVYIKIQ